MEQELREDLGVDVDVIPARLVKPHVLASVGRIALRRTRCAPTSSLSRQRWAGSLYTCDPQPGQR